MGSVRRGSPVRRVGAVDLQVAVHPRCCSSTSSTSPAPASSSKGCAGPSTDDRRGSSRGAVRCSLFSGERVSVAEEDPDGLRRVLAELRCLAEDLLHEMLRSETEVLGGERADVQGVDLEAVAVARRTHEALTLMLMAYAKSEAMHETPLEQYGDLRHFWGQFLDSLMSKVKNVI